MKPRMHLFLLVLGTALCAAPALAQYSQDFEAFTASPGGTPVAGQDSFYVPVTSPASVDFNAYTYAGNTLGVAPNPTGGAQFAAGVGPGGSPSVFARSQRNLTFTAGTWTMGADILAMYGGTPPTVQNLGSISLQDSTLQMGVIMLARWTSTATPTTWNADYVFHNLTGTSQTRSVPNAGFQNLPVNTWYHWETDLSFDGKQVVACRLTNLSTGAVAEHFPSDWYLSLHLTGPLPTGFRMFAGGSGGTGGNTLAFDNISFASRSEVPISRMVYSGNLTTTNVSLDVACGPPNGLVHIFLSPSTIPPVGIPGIGTLNLNLATLIYLGIFPLNAAGAFSLPLSHPAVPLPYAVVMQALTLSPGGAFTLTNQVAGGQGDIGTANATATYSGRSGTYRVVANGPSGTTVQLFTDIGGTETPIAGASTIGATGTITIPTATATPAYLTAPLAWGNKFRVKLNGITVLDLDN